MYVPSANQQNHPVFQSNITVANSTFLNVSHLIAHLVSLGILKCNSRFLTEESDLITSIEGICIIKNYGPLLGIGKANSLV